jgi:acyl carrier protein
MNDIEDRLVKCFMLAMPGLELAAVKDASRAAVAEWDSLTTVGILSLVEEEFGIAIPAEDVQECVSFERVLNLVGRQCGSP